MTNQLTVETIETVASLAVKKKALPDPGLFQVSDHPAPRTRTSCGTIEEHFSNQNIDI